MTAYNQLERFYAAAIMTNSKQRIRPLLVRAHQCKADYPVE